MNSAVSSHLKSSARIVSRCVVKGCPELVAVEDAFCKRHNDAMPFALFCEIFVAWEDFLIACREMEIAEAHDALFRWSAVQRRARKFLEAKEAGHAA